MNPTQMAKSRGVSVNTIYKHIRKLRSKGLVVDVHWKTYSERTTQGIKVERIDCNTHDEVLSDIELFFQQLKERFYAMEEDRSTIPRLLGETHILAFYGIYLETKIFTNERLACPWSIKEKIRRRDRERWTYFFKEGGVCTICGINRAKELHHTRLTIKTDYKERYQYALCMSCHAEIHRQVNSGEWIKVPLPPLDFQWKGKNNKKSSGTGNYIRVPRVYVHVPVPVPKFNIGAELHETGGVGKDFRGTKRKVG